MAQGPSPGATSHATRVLRVLPPNGRMSYGWVAYYSAIPTSLVPWAIRELVRRGLVQRDDRCLLLTEEGRAERKY